MYIYMYMFMDVYIFISIYIYTYMYIHTSCRYFYKYICHITYTYACSKHINMNEHGTHSMCLGIDDQSIGLCLPSGGLLGS